MINLNLIKTIYPIVTITWLDKLHYFLSCLYQVFRIFCLFLLCEMWLLVRFIQWCYMEASEPKWFNPVLNGIGVNSLRLGGLHINTLFVRFNGAVVSVVETSKDCTSAWHLPWSYNQGIFFLNIYGLRGSIRIVTPWWRVSCLGLCGRDTCPKS